jgi:parallel beta-helix repeat protein
VSIGYSNTITATNSFISLFGGGGYNVAYNTLSNTAVNPAGGSGIFACDVTNTTISGNTITKPNFSGIAIRDCGAGPLSGVRVNNNTVTGAGGNGLDISTAIVNGVQASYNTLTSNAIDGILLDTATQQDRLIYNTAKSNGSFDCHDLGTANVWQGNKGTTSSPPGRCTP